jgi:hypothetical protein
VRLAADDEFVLSRQTTILSSPPRPKTLLWPERKAW